MKTDNLYRLTPINEVDLSKIEYKKRYFTLRNNDENSHECHYGFRIKSPYPQDRISHIMLPFEQGKKKPKCDVCGSTDITEVPHMGVNCNKCHPL